MKAKKSLYRIKNWKEYNDSLVSRGSLTIWFSNDAKKGWLYQGIQKQGHPIVFSDIAIETALTIRSVYHLPLRQTEGFLLSIFDILGTRLPVPDYTTLCKRTKNLSISLPLNKNNEPIHLVIDASGLKVYGEGEWKVKIHGKSKRRAWRKIHLGMNVFTGEIQAEELTEAFAKDSKSVEPLLRQIDEPIIMAALDSAYDTHEVFDLFNERGTVVLIPPRKTAKITKHGNATGPPLQRDEIIRAIRKSSRKRWKEDSGYHMRSLAETAMYRQKIIFGSNLRNRKFKNQKAEFSIRCKAQNIMTHQGMPISQKVI
jgi:hypothetical protein